MIGRTISHYSIIARLGEGGMGVVYLAEDLNLGRRVALKFLPPYMSNDHQARQRFKREAKAAAALDHPGICTVHEVAEADGELFIAMAFLEGQTLKDRLANGPLPIAEALQLAAQIADALQEAHSRGIVHRDIKPANIMLTPNGEARLMDFGLARLIEATQLTRDGTRIGTCAYMSPEQLLAEKVDGRTDVWSLGVVIHEMISGRRPFLGDSVSALQHGIIHVEPTPLTGLRTGVPLDLDRIAAKCMAKDVSERYQHADELAVDLRRLIAKMSAGKRSSFTARDRTRSTALRLRIAAGFVAILAVGAAVIVRHVGRDDPHREIVVAVLDFHNLISPADLLTALCLTNLVQVGMVENCPVRVISSEYLLEIRSRLHGQQEGLTQPGQALQIARRAGASLFLSGTLVSAGTSPLVSWQLVETSRGHSVAASRLDGADLVNAADCIIAAVLPVIADMANMASPTNVQSVNELTTTFPGAYRHYVTGVHALMREDWISARRELSEAVAIDTAFALAYIRLSDNELLMNNFDHARGHAEHAWRHRYRLSLKERMLVEARRTHLDGRLEEALVTYEEMLARWPDDLSLLHNVSHVQQWSRRWDAALITTRQGLDRYPSDPKLLQYRTISLNGLGQVESAMAETRAWLRVSPFDAMAWNSLGEIFLSMGEPDSAAAAFARMQKLEPTNELSYQMDLSRCAFARGDVDEAINLCLEQWHRTDLTLSDRFLVLWGWGGGSLGSYSLEAGRTRLAMDLNDELASRHGNHETRRSIVDTGFSMIAQWGFEEGHPVEIAFDSHDVSDNPLTRSKLLMFTCPESTQAMRRVLEDMDRTMPVSPQSSTGLRRNRYRNWLLLHMAEGSYASAFEVYDALACIDPRFAQDHWRLRVRALLENGHHETAVDFLQGILRTRRGCLTAHYWLGRSYQDMGRHSEAAQEYRVFLDLWQDADPEQPQLSDARRRLASMTAGS